MSTPPVKTAIPRDVWVLVTAAFAVALGYGLIAPVLPQYAQSFDVSVTAATIVVSMFALFRLIFAPAGGLLVDRLGERWVYMTGLLIVAVSTLATGLAQGYWQLLVFRGLGGIGSTMFTISAMALLVRLAPPNARGRISGLYATAFLVGNITGPILGGFLGRYGMRVPFFVYAIMLLVATAVVAFAMAGGRRRQFDANNPEPPPMTLGHAWEHTAYRAALVSSFANGFAAFGVRIAIIPLFAASTFDQGPAVAGMALGSFAAGTASVVTAAGYLADRVGRRPLIITGLVVVGVSTILLGRSDTVTMLVVYSVIAGIGSGILNPAQQASVADVIGADRAGGKVMATFQMASDLGAICGPVMVGVVVDHVGFATGFTLTGIILLMACVPWFFAHETLEQGENPVPQE